MGMLMVHDTMAEIDQNEEQNIVIRTNFSFAYQNKEN